MQKGMIAGLAGAWLLLVAPAWSTENSQQTKMTTCNADAKTKGLAGDDRKAFMKTCLSSGASAGG
jgi:psiF repeat